jgi:hypothetical protein
MYILQLFLHPIYIFYWIGILELLLLTLNCTIKFNEVVVTTNRLHSWFKVSSAKQTFRLVKERVNYSIYKAIG